MRAPHASLTNAEVIVAGAAGAVNRVFVKLTPLVKLLPHNAEYANLTLSPAIAAAFEVNFIFTTLEVNDPESTTAFAPNVPTKDHCHPVAAPIKPGAS